MHAVALVIGEDFDYQMAPFQEYGCTGVRDEFVVEVDITDDVLADVKKVGLRKALDYNFQQSQIISCAEEIGSDRSHNFGYVIVNNKKVIKAVTITNPNSRWDWYVVGGRWDGFLRTKSGKEIISERVSQEKAMSAAIKSMFVPIKKEENIGGVNQAAVGDIDWDRMIEGVIDAANATYDEFEAVLKRAGLEASNLWLPYSAFGFTRHMEYKAQENLKKYYQAISSADWMSVNWEMSVERDNFIHGREWYVQHKLKQAGMPYAIVHNREWRERQKGMSSAEWRKVVMDILNSLPPETLVTVIDYHY